MVTTTVHCTYCGSEDCRVSYVKANLLLTHFGNLKWTHPHGGERESVFRHRERATALICSAMAAQSVPSEEPGIKVAPSAPLRSLDTRFLRWFEKRAHCLCEKNNVLFFRSRRVKSHGKTPAIQQRESLFWSCLLSLVAILHAVRLPIDRQDFCVM